MQKKSGAHLVQWQRQHLTPRSGGGLTLCLLAAAIKHACATQGRHVVARRTELRPWVELAIKSTHSQHQMFSGRGILLVVDIAPSIHLCALPGFHFICQGPLKLPSTLTLSFTLLTKTEFWLVSDFHYLL